MNFLDISNAEEFTMWEISNSDIGDYCGLAELANLVYGQYDAPEGLPQISPADAIDNWILKNIHWLKELSSHNSSITKRNTSIEFKLGPYAWRIYHTDEVFREVYAKLHVDEEDI